MSQQLRERLSKIGLGAWFAAFLVFLYGPVLVMLVLSLQGQSGGSGFPAVGVPSGYWYNYLTGPNSSALRSATAVSRPALWAIGCSQRPSTSSRPL